MSTQTRSISFAVVSIALFGSVSAQARDVGWYVTTQAQSPIWVQVANKEHQNDHQLLQGNREVLGKVEAIISDQIKVDVGEVQPRFLPLQQAKEKHFPSIQLGDNLIIVVNEQNLIVDYHPLDHPSSHHTIIRGTIAGNMPTGHDVVVIKGAEGKEQSFTVRSQVRSKVASIPVGTPAIFLVDETGRVADATFASLTAAKEAHKNPEDKSPSKAPLSRSVE